MRGKFCSSQLTPTRIQFIKPVVQCNARISVDLVPCLLETTGYMHKSVHRNIHDSHPRQLYENRCVQRSALSGMV